MVSFLYGHGFSETRALKLGNQQDTPEERGSPRKRGEGSSSHEEGARRVSREVRAKHSTGIQENVTFLQEIPECVCRRRVPESQTDKPASTGTVRWKERGCTAERAVLLLQSAVRTPLGVT